MSSLRRQMKADMVLRGLAYRTRKSYIEAVVSFAKHYGRSPELITQAECQSYLLYLLEDPKARIITLLRRSKKRPAVPAVRCTRVGTTAPAGKCGTFPVVATESIWSSRFGGCCAEAVKR